MINPPRVWEPRGLRPSPLPCDPLADGAATSPLMPQRTSGSEGLTGSDLKSTSKAAKLAGEKQQIAAIASAKRTARPRKKHVTTAKPLSSLRAYRPMLRKHGAPRAFSLPRTLILCAERLQQKVLRLVRSYNFLRMNPFQPRISPTRVASSSKITASDCKPQYSNISYRL